MTWKPVWDKPMPTPASIDEKWVDIVSPVAPSHTVDPLGIGVVAAGLLVLLGLVVMLYRRPRARAKRALRRLARDLRGARVGAKPVCVQVQQCLRSGLGRHQLQSVQWRDDHCADWLAYVNRLAQCCFAAPSPSRAELEAIIHEALAWLDTKAVAR